MGKNTQVIPYGVARRKFATSLPNEKAGSVQPIYDTLVYPKAGITQLSFFQEQQGGASGKSFEQTNMTMSSQLSKGVDALLTGIQIEFLSGVANATDSTADPTVISEFINDVATVINSGWFELTILDKVWLRDAPISKAPPLSRLIANGALAIDKTTATNGLQIQVAQAGGAYYELAKMWIMSNASFGFTLNWENKIPLPSNVDGTIRVTLDNIQYRNAA